MNHLKQGQKVNIEFDMLGKYINRKLLFPQNVSPFI